MGRLKLADVMDRQRQVRYQDGRVPLNPVRRPLSVGARLGGWVVVGDGRMFAAPNKDRLRYPCRCQCGRLELVLAQNLLNGTAKSCGCVPRAFNGTHGGSRTLLYGCWRSMHQRCYKPCSRREARNYAERGIKVCPEWATFEPFRDWALANGYGPKLRLDRRNNDLGYSPENCRWATQMEQCHNTRRNVLLTLFGETKCITEWGRDPRATVGMAGIRRRLAAGWLVEEAITGARRWSRFKEKRPG